VHPLQRGDRSVARGHHVALAAGEEHAPEPAHRAQLDHGDVRGLLGLVGGDGDVGRGGDLHDEQTLSRHQHRALAPLVQQLRLVGMDVRDELRRRDPRPDPVRLGQSQLVEHGLPGGEHLRLLLRVDLQQAELALDDLQRRSHPGGLERDVRGPEHLVARGHLDVELGHAGQGDVAGAGRRDVRRALRLHPVDERVGPQRGGHGADLAIPSGVMSRACG
jgi:hypothetical protein